MREFMSHLVPGSRCWRLPASQGLIFHYVRRSSVRLHFGVHLGSRFHLFPLSLLPSSIPRNPPEARQAPLFFVLFHFLFSCHFLSASCSRLLFTFRSPDRHLAGDKSTCLVPQNRSRDLKLGSSIVERNALTCDIRVQRAVSGTSRCTG